MTKRGLPINFHDICRHGSVEDVREAIECHGDHIVNTPDEKGYSPLYFTCNLENRLEITKILLQNGAMCQWISPINGWTPLAAAVLRLDVNLVNLLLTYILPHDVNNFTFTKHRHSLLYIVCHGGSFDSKNASSIIKILLTKGADPFYRNTKNDSALASCCARGTLCMVKSFIESIDTGDVISKLLNSKHPTARTPLMCAAFNSAEGPEIIKYLLSKGADPLFIPRSNDENAYICAYNEGPPQCLAALPIQHIPYISNRGIISTSFNPLELAKVAILYGYIKNANRYPQSFQHIRTTRHRWSYLRQHCNLLDFPMKKRQAFPNDYIVWQQESSTRSASFALHWAAAETIELTRKVMQMWINPLIPNEKGQLPVDVAATPEIRRVLRQYATWNPNVPQKTWWYRRLSFLCFLRSAKNYKKQVWSIFSATSTRIFASLFTLGKRPTARDSLHDCSPYCQQ
jgi:ankyrin repeat protein